MVEALLAIVVLAFAAAVMTGLYVSGLQAMDAQTDRMTLDSSLRSRMEFLLSQNFDQLTNGTDTISVNGQNYTLSWTINNTDLDGDSVAESTAKMIEVTVEGRTLTTIVVDHEGQIGKI